MRREPVLMLGLGVGLLIVAAAALQLAVGWYGHPIAGMLVDVGGHVSTMGPADWEAKQKGLVFPDRITSVDGQRLEGCGSRCGEAYSALVSRAALEGRDHVRIGVVTRSGERELTLGIRPLEPFSWWVLACGCLLVGVLWSGAGLLAVWAAPASALARTTGKLGTLCGLFMLTVFDFHTTGKLVPLFFLAFGTVPISWLVLALRLPTDALPSRTLKWIERASEIIGVVFAAALVAWDATGKSTTSLQTIASLAFGVSVLAFSVIFVVRLMRSRGRERQTLRALAFAITPYVVAGIMLFAGAAGRWPFANMLLFPALGLLPIATVWAFIRHDLWGSRALLSRLLTRIAIGAGVAGLAMAGGTAVAVALDVPFRQALIGAGAGGLIAAALVALALNLSDRLLFPARAAYKPSVAQLSAELTSIRSPEEVARAIERTVERWLPSKGELALLEPEPIPCDAAAASVSTPEGGVVLPVSFAAQRLGELRVGPKSGGALFTSEDMELLSTIADQGGLALAHAHAYQELEHRRREQATAWRGEREALIETMAGEVAHEVRTPINFFRSMFEQAGSIDEDEAKAGREEVERLERLFHGLRRMAGQKLERQDMSIRELCERAERLLRDALGDRRVALDLPDGAILRCDPDKATQILVNLLSNAIEASGPDGEVGISFAGNHLEVWDSGPGFVGDPSMLFAPWYTTKARGTGLGLAITFRLCTAHDWNITATRRDGRTVFVVSLEGADVGARAPDDVQVA